MLESDSRICYFLFHFGVLELSCQFSPDTEAMKQRIGKAMPGLEISSLAVIDVEANTALYLECE
jgi:hypothetical protein